MNEKIKKTEYIGQMLHIKPHYIVSLPAYHSDYKFKSVRQLANEANLKLNQNGSDISQKSDKKIRSAINWLLVSAEDKKVYQKLKDRWFDFKVNFITLTLPDTQQQINNKAFKNELLEPWLNLMRTHYKLKNYVWKMEFQGNGKLHCHITTDTFIHYKVIQTSWNNLLRRNNYLIDFAKKFEHSNPNSTDIHSVRKIKDLAAYLCKYMAKGTGSKETFEGRIWGCSQKISEAMKTSYFMCRSENGHPIQCLFHKNIEYSALTIIDKNTQQPRRWGEIYFLKFKNWLHDIDGVIKQTFTDAILNIRGVTSNTAQLQHYSV